VDVLKAIGFVVGIIVLGDCCVYRMVRTSNSAPTQTRTGIHICLRQRWRLCPRIDRWRKGVSEYRISWGRRCATLYQVSLWIAYAWPSNQRILAASTTAETNSDQSSP